jgi:DNA-binding XRE family transcriptional regulator
MTQQEAADLLGITRSHFGHVERGSYKASTPVARRFVALFPELTRDQVLFPEEYPQQPTGRMPLRINSKDRNAAA